MSAPLAFVEVLRPWIADGERRIIRTSRSVDRALTATATAGLVAGLAQELASVVAPTMLDRFLRFPGRRWLDPSSTTAYNAFVEGLASGGMALVCLELPELARVLDDVVAGWVRRVATLMARVDHDRDLLADDYALRLPFLRAVPIEEGAVALGDMAGTWVMYKDRPLAMEAALSEMIRWVNAQAPNTGLYAPGVIDRGEYGWMEYIPHHPERDLRAWPVCLARSGMLMGLVHALGGGDIHAGNLRVNGAHPVIVDSEVLLRPRRARAIGDVASVLATGWLPTPQEVERCGLAFAQYEVRPRRWLHVGTDAIRQRPLRSPFATIRPDVVEHFRDDVLPYVEDLCRGFREMYELVLARGLPLDLFADASPRALLRTSYLYQEAVERSLRPEALKSARSRNAALEELVRSTPSSARDVPAVAAAVANAERASMQALRVPRFTVPAAGRTLLWHDRPLGELFCRSPLERARAFVGNMSLEAMDSQCLEIRNAVASAVGGSFAGWSVDIEIVA